MATKNSKFWLTLVIFSLIGQVAWVVENMYFNVFIYKMFSASATDISLMVAASAVTATLTTVLIGALSDSIGNRKAFICGGYILWGISIMAFAFINTETVSALFPFAASVSAVCITLVIIFDCIMTFFGSSANDACFNAWLTDSTNDSNRGAAEGINSMMPLVAILVVFGGFLGFNLDKAESWTSIFLIIGITVLIIGIVGIFTIKESTIKIEENKNYFKNIIHGFTPNVIKSNPMLYLCLICFTIFGIAIQIFMPYLIIYYEKSLGLTDYVFIMAPAIILASVFTALFGRLYDKIGFAKSVILSTALLMLGFVILYLFKNTALVFVGSLLMMCGYLSGTAAFGAVIRHYTPKGKAGMFQGLRIVGQVLIPGIVGPAIGAAVLKNAETILNSDGTVSFLPNENIFLAALIVTFALCAALAFTILKMKKENTNNA